jgi:hypothetical protein
MQMHKKLPTEVFTTVTSFLPLQDNVCKKWYDIITTSNLYETFDFKKISVNYKEALDLFHKNLYIGQHFKHLILSYPSPFNIIPRVVSSSSAVQIWKDLNWVCGLLKLFGMLLYARTFSR